MTVTKVIHFRAFLHILCTQEWMNHHSNHPILIVSVLEIHFSLLKLRVLKLWTLHCRIFQNSPTAIFSHDLNNHAPRFSASIRRIFGSLNGVSSYSCILWIFWTFFSFSFLIHSQSHPLRFHSHSVIISLVLILSLSRRSLAFFSPLGLLYSLFSLSSPFYSLLSFSFLCFLLVRFSSLPHIFISFHRF